MSPSTGNRWLHRWNEGGLGLLTPSFGAGSPPTLDETQQQTLLDLLREGQPWKSPWKSQELEATTNYFYIYDMLSEYLDVVVGHPPKLKAIAVTAAPSVNSRHYDSHLWW